MDALPAPLQSVLARASAGRSPARVRQLRWVAGELAAYAATLPRPRRPTRGGGWCDPAFVAGYLAAADAGQLRRRTPRRRAPAPSDASRRVRRACLRLLAAGAGVPDPVPDHVPLPAPLPPAEPRPAALALAHLRGVAGPRAASAGAVRAAAMAVLTHELGLRTGELAALTTGDVDLPAATLTYVPHPPAARAPEPARTVTLSPVALEVLTHWLAVRAELTAAVPRTRHLWVSLAANHDGAGLTRPPGLPLHPNGVRRAHARAVAAVNFDLAGSPGFRPLPRTPGLLRPATT